MQNRLQYLVRLAHDSGLAVIEKYPANNRFHCVAQAENGATERFALQNKPGDQRGDQNERARMRRFARLNLVSAPIEPEPVAPPVANAFEPLPEKEKTVITVIPKPERDMSAFVSAKEFNPRKRNVTVSVAVQELQLDKSAVAAAAPVVTAAAQDLTPKEFYRACEWLKGEPLGRFPDIDALALGMSAHVGQTVCESTVREVMEAIDLHTPDHWLPPLDPAIVVARELAALMRQLGNEPSKDFSRLLAGIAA